MLITGGRKLNHRRRPFNRSSQRLPMSSSILNPSSLSSPQRHRNGLLDQIHRLEQIHFPDPRCLQPSPGC